MIVDKFLIFAGFLGWVLSDSQRKNQTVSPGQWLTECSCCWVQSHAACPHLPVHWHTCISREPSFFLLLAVISADSASTACVLSVAIPANLSGRGCPQFDSLLSSRVWKRIKLKLLPKALYCLQYVCMHLVAINFECLVLHTVILAATLQQKGNAFLSFLEIRCWHVKAERLAHGL